MVSILPKNTNSEWKDIMPSEQLIETPMLQQKTSKILVLGIKSSYAKTINLRSSFKKVFPKYFGDGAFKKDMGYIF